MNSLSLLGFRSNSDLGDFLFFGKGIEAWLYYTLIFFAFTSVAFILTWLSGLVLEKNKEESIE